MLPMSIRALPGFMKYIKIRSLLHALPYCWGIVSSVCLFKRKLAIKCANKPVGICGQALSDYQEFAAFLVQEGIDSISLNPDSVIAVKNHVAEAEAKLNSK